LSSSTLQKFGLHPLGCQSSGVAYQLIKARALKRRASEFGQYFLLNGCAF
jgi:hypothetical protein